VRLFVDSSGWTALFHNRDKFRARARAFIQSLAGQQVEFVTTDYILDETITNLQSGVNHSTAEKFGRWVLQQENVTIIHISESDWVEAWELFQQYDDKDFSFTDCTSFVVMRQLKLEDAFTFDHHFEQIGFTQWP